ncbi:MAG: GGDEF domain-containing protein [Rhodospirillales bacterium]|nr:GGDEF domain-containing protein [Rhodospirillales bacterium]
MLDPFTLIIALTATHFLATAILVSVWYVNRSIPGLGSWAIGRAFLSLALVMLAYQEHMHLGFAVLLGNSLMMVGLYFIWRGSLAFMGRPHSSLALFAALYVAILSGMVYWATVEPNFTARAVLSCIAILVFDIFSFRALWPRKGDEIYFFGKLIAVAFVLNGILQIIRAFVSLLGGNGKTLLEPSAATQLALMTAIVMTMISAMGFMALVMEYLKKDLKRQAERDPLTGAYNRRAFDTLANHIFARGRRERGAVSLVILDLDHFKSINDCHGHAAGDLVLKRVVSLVQNILRAEDILVRLGGEEFAIMLPSATLDEALHIAERIRTTIEAESFAIAPEAVRVTTSLGVTSIASIGATDAIDEMIKKADTALYQAKDAGRNRVCIFQEAA